MQELLGSVGIVYVKPRRRSPQSLLNPHSKVSLQSRESVIDSREVRVSNVLS